jgi:cysteine desulfurase
MEDISQSSYYRGRIMIYLDYNATTPVLPEVLEAMMPYLTSEWGNPSSTYKFGSKLKAVIEMARAQAAELIGAHAMEIIFTSCATESNNAAVHASLKANPKKKHIITSAVEHSSVLNYCMALQKEGFQVTYLPVDGGGLLKLADLESAISDETAVVSLMWANEGLSCPYLSTTGLTKWPIGEGNLQAQRTRRNLGAVAEKLAVCF